MSAKDSPTLAGDALKAALHRGSHVQLIAAAGSGKTETVAQRIAHLVKEGVPPSEIVAFTFTKKAATELKSRVRLRVSGLAGKEKADALGPLFVGTIHAFCLNILTKQDSRFEAYSPIDEHQLAAFCLRYANFLNLETLGAGTRIEGLKRFLQTLGAIENEGLFDATIGDARELTEQAPDFDSRDDEADWYSRLPLQSQFALSVEKLDRLLDIHRLLTFDQQIRLAIELLTDPEKHAELTSGIRHLIVDEYQDVNKPQETLIGFLASTKGRAEVVVVGDDDQAIYQFRGSQVENILTFGERYPGVVKFELSENRRSNAPIVNAAAAFASTISNRNDKTMRPTLDDPYPSLAAKLDFETETSEVQGLVDTIMQLKLGGWRYSDMAILVRGGASLREIIRALEVHQIPIEAGERASVFDQDDAAFFGKAFNWLAGASWKSSPWDDERTELNLDLLKEIADARFTETSGVAYNWNKLEAILIDLKNSTEMDSRTISLTDWAYRIAQGCGIQSWDVDDPVLGARLGSIARFFTITANYESMAKSARKDPSRKEGQVGVSDTGVWHIRNFSWYVSYYALEKVKGFGGDTRGQVLEEVSSELDAVSLLTVHASKGLEWPIVFMPSLTANRFPSTMLGRPQKWLVPRDRFNVRKYEGEIDDERRVFYVGLTRAKNWLCLSGHKLPINGSKEVSPSPFADFLVKHPDLDVHPMSNVPSVEMRSSNKSDSGPVQFSFSEISQFLNCGLSYKLRSVLEFPSVIVPAIGYGKSIHHVVRVLIELTAQRQSLPSREEIEQVVSQEFFLPFAGSGVSKKLMSSALEIVTQFVEVHGEDFHKVSEMERPFELPISDSRSVTGRADAVFSSDEGSAIRIVDFKTDAPSADHGMQVQIYAAAAQLEGIQVESAEVHNLKSNVPIEFSIQPSALADAVGKVDSAISEIEARKFLPNPSKKTCKACDVARICAHSMDPKPKKDSRQ
jgi:DNA helicase-2/ATP-dependent DNA helicase PcrA